MSDTTVTTPQGPTFTPSRAARELEIRRGEFDLAVRLGHVRTVPDEGGGGRRVTCAELDRLRAQTGFPEVLRTRVHTVGTKEAAELLDVPPGRFTRLARLGVLVPVTFYLNRYRAVVWRYLAEELRQFAAADDNRPLLTARTPSGLREQLDEGLDLRARNWRGRQLGFLLREADGHPWARAAAVASLLDLVQVAEIVPDPYERAQLARFRPRPMVHGTPGSPTAQLAERIATAVEPDEIGWLRADLAQAVDEARAQQPAPRPTPKPTAPLPTPAPAAEPTPSPAPWTGGRHRQEPRHARGLLSRLRRTNRRLAECRTGEPGA
ncbi:DUF6397 family protein [Streptomyces sp. NPDC091279]|uniref:DUF6397 family protein n=1 Tax=unclassified Streptomyces TaxID=2593676 RepID=UPI003828F806